jgi:hypothetical protein
MSHVAHRPRGIHDESSDGLLASVIVHPRSGGHTAWNSSESARRGAPGFSIIETRRAVLAGLGVRTGVEKCADRTRTPRPTNLLMARRVGPRILPGRGDVRLSADHSQGKTIVPPSAARGILLRP